MAPSETVSAGGTRELAAIMFSDLVGYTAIMGRDEREGLRARATHRELLRTLVERFNGRMISDAGDGALSSFHSAVDAVNCACAPQASLSNEADLRVRIGIHLGDVLHSEGTIVGDGVNVASRIQALAPPGAVCISGNVYDEIRNKPDIRVRDLGAQKLKNVTRPIRVYVLDATAAGGAMSRLSALRTRNLARGTAVVAVLAVMIAGYLYRAELQSAWREHVPAAEPTQATIAVLPFTNLSGDKNDDYFSDGMTDEIIGDLSKIAGLRVAGRTSSFMFKGRNEEPGKIASLLHVHNLLEGSVRRGANKVRIEVQLTDAVSGFNLWSETYDKDLSDVFAIQSDVAKQVAENLRVKLLASEQARIERRPTQDLEAYNLYLEGKAYNYSEPVKAREYYSRAVEKDPDFAAAYVAIADIYGFIADVEMPSRDAIAKVEELDRRALSIDGELSAAHESIANYVLTQSQWNWKAAEEEYKVALKLDPSNADAYAWYGWLFGWTRRYDEAIPQAQRAHELDPLSPLYLTALGDLTRESGQYQRALEYHRQVIEMAPSFLLGYSARAYDLIGLGEVSEGLADLEKCRAAYPDGPFFAASLAGTYGRIGKRSEAAKILEQLKEMAKHRFVSNFLFFLAYAGAGDMDRAYEYLEKAYQDHSVFIPFLSTREFDWLRADPRFQAVYSRVWPADVTH